MLTEIERAEALHSKAKELAILFAQYEGRHGRNGPQADSSEGQWNDAEALFKKQIEIVKLLELEVTEGKPVGVSGRHFNHFLNSANINRINESTLHLLSTAYRRAEGASASTPDGAQRSIANMLDPRAVREALKGG